jgi:putative hydrolase of the HAD superfamily
MAPQPLHWKLIKTIIFDLGQVLVCFDWKRGYSALAEFSPYPPEEVRARIKETRLFDLFERGRVEPRDLARQIGAALEMDVPFEKFRELWSSIFSPEMLLPESMLAGLHAGHRLLLLSNTDAIHFDWITEKYSIIGHMDHCVVSFDVGCRKPEPEIYREAIAHARCAPEEIFFTDDIMENVEGARQTGIDAVQFQSRAQLEEELKARGVRW